MSTLHIFTQSPFSAVQSLQRCLSMCGDQDAVLFIQDGVYIVQHQDLPAKLTHFLLSEDLAARGLSARAQSRPCVTYSGFVDLVCHYGNSITWGSV